MKGLFGLSGNTVAAYGLGDFLFHIGRQLFESKYLRRQEKVCNITVKGISQAVKGAAGVALIPLNSANSREIHGWIAHFSQGSLGESCASPEQPDPIAGQFVSVIELLQGR